MYPLYTTPTYCVHVQFTILGTWLSWTINHLYTTHTNRVHAKTKLRWLSYKQSIIHIVVIPYTQILFMSRNLIIGCWSSVYKEDYLQIFKCVSFWLHSCCGKWAGWDPVNRFNHTSWVAIITPTDRPVGLQSLCNRIFWLRFCVVALLFGLFRGCRGFCHTGRTESDLFLFLIELCPTFLPYCTYTKSQ